MLQNWVTTYTKLSIDSARQVREAAQQGTQLNDMTIFIVDDRYG